MASNDVRLPTPNEMSRARLRDIVEAQMWESQPHEYVVPESAVLRVGSRMRVVDADGRIIALSPSLLAEGHMLDPDSVSWELAHPPEPEPEPELGPLTVPAPLDAHEMREVERELQEWREQYDPKQQARARNALRMRRVRAEGRDRTRGSPDPNEKRGRKPKYTRFGALLKYTVKQETAE